VVDDGKAFLSSYLPKENLEMKFTATIHIHRPFEEVFTYMSNIEHEVQWRNLVDVKVTSGLPLRQGSTYR
jgi:hypothetical protein